jgi:photosystem II stability/assembly factor-like uncharacterized protein
MKKLLVVLVMLAAMNASAQWVQMSNGMGNNKSVYSLAINGNNIYAGIDSAVYVSTNNGLSWAETSLNNRLVLTFAFSGNNIFAGTRDNGIYKSTNNGINWSQICLNGITVPDIKVIGNNIFAATFGMGDGLYVSSNNGLNWSLTTLDSISIYYLASTGNNIFAGTASNGVYLSSNNGTNWSQTTLNNEHVTRLGFIGNNIFAGSYSGVYISTNNGIVWSQTALSNKMVLSLAITGNNIFVGTFQYAQDSGSFYISSNNGVSWNENHLGFNAASSVRAILISNNYVFIGTEGNSVWRRSLSELIGIQNLGTEIPSKFSLSQNYPNPFNPVTKIRFDVPENGKLKTENDLTEIRVYDLLGREVAILVNEKLNPGSYEVTFDGSSLNSGVYFYKLVINGFSETKKMLLIK